MSCCCLVSKSCLTLCYPKDCSMPGSPVPPLSPRVCSNSSPLSQWCCLTISSSTAPFSFCLQFFPATGSFSMSRLFTSGGQNIGASASVLPKKYSGLISFRIACFDFLAVQETLKSLRVAWSIYTVQDTSLDSDETGYIIKKFSDEIKVWGLSLGAPMFLRASKEQRRWLSKIR